MRAALRVITDHPAVTGAINFLPSPFTLVDATRLIVGADDGRDRFLGAWRRENHESVAVVGTHLRGEREIEIAYWVGADHHGQGYATEAVSTVLAILRERLPARRLMAECRPENRASWHLLGKLGFRPSGDAGRRPGRRHLVTG